MDHLEEKSKHYHPKEVMVAMEATTGERSIVVKAVECHTQEEALVVFETDDMGGFLQALATYMAPEQPYKRDTENDN